MVFSSKVGTDTSDSMAMEKASMPLPARWRDPASGSVSTAWDGGSDWDQASLGVSAKTVAPCDPTPNKVAEEG